MADRPPSWRPELAHTTEDWTQDNGQLPRSPGAYLLHVDLLEPVVLPETLGGGRLPIGRYCYAGSARGPGGIRARCRRHLDGPRRVRWHVDHLTSAEATVHAAAFPDHSECALVEALIDQPGVTVPVRGFGSSDCYRCPAHLLALGAAIDPQALLDRICASLGADQSAGARFVQSVSRS